MAKILITGGAGFIGSNLAEAMLKEQHDVRILDNFSSGRRENIVEFQNLPNFEIMEGDIRDLHCCLQACDHIDAVFHMAALGSVPRSISEPINSNENNISGTLNMLVAAKEKKVDRFISASSSSVYGNRDAMDLSPRKETDFPSPISPYAITKYGIELYSSQFYKLYGLKTICLRFFNVFGKKQNPDSQYAAVIPLFISKLMRHEIPSIFGDGMTSRDFTHVSNVIHACNLCLSAPENAFGEVFNAACGSSISLNTLYEAIAKELSTDVKPLYAPERKGDIKYSIADITKAEQILNYKAITSFNDGIKQTVDWFKSKP